MANGRPTLTAFQAAGPTRRLESGRAEAAEWRCADAGNVQNSKSQERLRTGFGKPANVTNEHVFHNLPLFDGKAALDLLGCGMAIAATRPTCKATSSDLAVFKGHAE
jgi:hypothetical protein